MNYNTFSITNCIKKIFKKGAKSISARPVGPGQQGVDATVEHSLWQFVGLQGAAEENGAKANPTVGRCAGRDGPGTTGWGAVSIGERREIPVDG